MLALRTMRFVILFISAIITAAATAGDHTFRSPEIRTAMIELYTSEGCSSCPSAEAWLGGLKNEPGLWRDFVPVAFHVDYWDYLGWKDRFASAANTQRQRSLAGTWASHSVYTPCFVLDGAEWRARRVPSAGKETVGVLEARVSGGKITVTYSPSQQPAQPREVWLAVLGGGLASDVKAGENAGRKLTQDFVALSVSKAPLVFSEGKQTAALTFTKTENAKALALWVTAKGSLAPQQATGEWLPLP